MALANADDVIKTFPSDRADQAAYRSAKARRRDRSVANAHGPDAPDEGSASRAVAVADQVAWGLVPAAGLGQRTGKRSSRRDCRRMRSPYTSPNEIVGTTKMSIDAMAST